MSNFYMKNILGLLFFCLLLLTQYQLGLESQRQNGVPKAEVAKYIWHSTSYANYRECYVYVLAQYEAYVSAALMDVQDGHSNVNKQGG
ncbi:MAG: hypothetical protein ACI9DJ_000804 [Algoriphagus sp.]|jgi:hypothetical protein